jgi:DNA repair protein RecN (Recombination protein N)
MLTHLHIRDLAIVESLELEFTGGLTVLTGETGAGKSIVVDALTLVCGARATADLIRAGADKAEIAARFDIRQLPRTLRALLEEQSIEAEDELLVRRVITADGRSRAYLNGQSAAIQQLRDVVGGLLDVHGQHEFQSLVRSGAQRELLDRYGRLDPLTGQVANTHAVWLDLLNRQLAIESRLRDRDARLELLRFHVGELAALDLKAGEAAELLGEAARLGNRGRLLEGSRLAAQLLLDDEADTAQSRIARAQSALKPLAAIEPALAQPLSLLEEAAIRITEAARELGHYADGLDLDSTRQGVVEKRLAAAEDVARKHRTTPGELPQLRETLATELATLETAEQDVATLRKQQTEALQAYRELATKLSEARVATASTLGKEITARMQTLGMKGGQFQVDVAPHASAEPQPHGLDQIEFRVTANPGQPLRPLAKVASGGELSRIALAIAVTTSQNATDNAPGTLIFDEIDVGIGGAVAETVGRLMKQLGRERQVLAVTHLPQVAACADRHLVVSKSLQDGATASRVAPVAGEARVAEIARMLGGERLSSTSLAHAEEMLAASAKARKAKS